ncbi:MAG: RdgB/HAM1 family non-canonical purine NTP pyrophosphatase [Muribaculaceae bacterium]|nr:RdgB/HAM1 family non-canonical purine NTP pyrophosphatase [Muribaculaceae bacterium]MDE5956743.1 RdgB/HAM1 family non-canonical purine NTP pyrophosphatase [Muribaculaceae bacterium]MDE6447619.1 RdgB/HAM1 family non-canonical purine NTP pyrophosphatase [Muribaculaceae bacterium]MDE7342950.1 RdgB/HAM1 family non-canonical purine NTP pyrophosphatase [Muribaculaceae bacterium]
MTDSPRRLVFASNNAHKLSEIRRMAGHRFEILSLEEIGCHDDIPETAATLEGNSLIKARWIKDKYGYDCFADDTGLLVDALDGAPGVKSARFAGEECDPEANMALLLKRMEGVADRHARFRTVVTLIMGSETFTFTGEVEGEIATERDGASGFGYDPVFIAAETGKTFASMDADAKNAISHRGRAIRKLFDHLSAI